MGVQETSIEVRIRAILRVKARVYRKKFEIRSLAYGRETNVTSLFSCCARRATRFRKTEGTDSLVSTESDEATTRDELYGGGGTNGVYENTFVRTAALADSDSLSTAFSLTKPDLSLLASK